MAGCVEMPIKEVGTVAYVYKKKLIKLKLKLYKSIWYGDLKIYNDLW